jgi:acetyltransferase-like isoleucine patch superfamily enzyme
LEEDVWLGGGVIVLDGVHIGKGSVISAGTVVTRDVKPNSIMAGVPARLISER